MGHQADHSRRRLDRSHRQLNQSHRQASKHRFRADQSGQTHPPHLVRQDTAQRLLRQRLWLKFQDSQHSLVCHCIRVWRQMFSLQLQLPQHTTKLLLRWDKDV